LIFFSDTAEAGGEEPQPRETVLEDLSQQWKVNFAQIGISENLDRLGSWTDNAKTKYFSGVATYERNFVLAPGNRGPQAKILLDFGQASPLSIPSPPGQNNMKAYLDAPIREAAQIFVNGEDAGVLWRPPYRLDVTRFVHEGRNELRIQVGNTAINELAGRALPDYRLLWDRYGMRFVPQDMDNLHPLPSGLLGPVTLLASTPGR
jgi:hypothetical protein